MPTDPEARVRADVPAYAPTKALFDKAWMLPDVEKVTAAESNETEVQICGRRCRDRQLRRRCAADGNVP